MQVRIPLAPILVIFLFLRLTSVQYANIHYNNHLALYFVCFLTWKSVIPVQDLHFTTEQLLYTLFIGKQFPIPAHATAVVNEYSFRAYRY